MKRTGLAWFLFGGGFLFSAAAFGLSSQLDSPPSLMSRADHAAARQVIDSEMRRAIGQCRGLEAHERAVCKVRARAENRVRRAELAARYYGTIAAAREAQEARVRAGYEVARAQCNDRVGRERTSCLTAARTDRNQSLALARPSAS